MTETQVDTRSPTRRWGQILVLLAPALVILVAGWQRRWLNEDAFINLRIVDQIFAGHGPVFNGGERVEAYTSPLWLGALVVVRATLGHVMAIEWATVVGCLAASVTAFAVGGRAARMLHDDREFVIPLGLIVVAAIPVVWDFSTSGLEVGVTWLWLAVSWAILLSVARAPQPDLGWARWAGLAVLGLGPVVRPDLGLVTVCLLAGWLLIVHQRRRLIADIAVAFAIPILYQVFRMGYFASLVPSTALAKDAGGLHVGQGVSYGADLLNTYWLWIPLVCVAVAIGLNVAQRRRTLGIACGAMVLGGVAHAGYMVIVGGDYMHGRFLLPALFAVALPASIGIASYNLRAYSLVGAALVWALICATTLRFDQPEASLFTVVPISDWRELVDGRVMPRETHNESFITGGEIHELYEQGERGFIPLLARVPVPGRDPDELAATLGSIGIPAYTAGHEVFVVDLAGLAEPLAARTSIVPGRAAGHRKQVDRAWYEARFAADPTGAKARAARRALQCAPLSDLLRAIDEPLTPGRFVSNLWNSFSFTRLHIPANPIEAEQELCAGEDAG
jgi:arabinofuranosyltransferase